MTPTRRQRVILISLVVSGVAISAGLALKAFQENLLYFFSPTQVEAGEAPESRNFRLGGMVVLGSVTRDTGSMTVNFVVTDYAHSIPVQYTGVERGKAWWFEVSYMKEMFFLAKRFWPNTTKTTCRRKWLRPWPNQERPVNHDS